MTAVIEKIPIAFRGIILQQIFSLKGQGIHMGHEGNTPGKPDKSWVLEQFSRRNLTQRDVASQMGIDPATLSYTLKGDRKLNLNELKQLSEILHLSTAEIMARWGFPMKLENPTVPLRCYVMDDGTLARTPEPHALIPAPSGLATDSYAIQVRSTEFPNAYWNGTTCFIPRGQFDIGHCISYLVLAETDDGRTLFGELSKGFEPGTYALTHPLSKHRNDGLALSTVAPINWFWRG